jgi:hypothetical protein
MKQVLAWVVFAGMLLGVGPASGVTVGDRIQLEVRTDGGRSLPFYSAAATYGKKKFYAEAVKGDEYTVVIRNLLPRRVGLVVAVDGRNIISGQKSWLRNNERMYILGPYETGEYRGWRTGSDRVNRFYFTDAADSYAAAFGDSSAMGVIAVAAYPEIDRQAALRSEELSKERSGAAAPQAPQAKQAPADRALESAGTGYGREEYSPMRIVSFEPEAKAVETILIKYEWRSTLCRMGIVACDSPRPPRNRLWDDGGYAPPPPPRRG